MSRSGAALLLAALAAGVLGVLAGLWWQTHADRTRAVAIAAPGPAVPRGVTPAAPGDLLPALTLPDLELEPGQWRLLDQVQADRVFLPATS